MEKWRRIAYCIRLDKMILALQQVKGEDGSVLKKKSEWQAMFKKELQ